MFWHSTLQIRRQSWAYFLIQRLSYCHGHVKHSQDDWEPRDDAPGDLSTHWSKVSQELHMQRLATTIPELWQPHEITYCWEAFDRDVRVLFRLAFWGCSTTRRQRIPRPSVFGVKLFSMLSIHWYRDIVNVSWLGHSQSFSIEQVRHCGFETYDFKDALMRGVTFKSKFPLSSQKPTYPSKAPFPRTIKPVCVNRPFIVTHSLIETSHNDSEQLLSAIATIQSSMHLLDFCTPNLQQTSTRSIRICVILMPPKWFLWTSMMTW